MSNFQWVWRYSCLNVTHKIPYKKYVGKTNDMYTCNKLQLQRKELTYTSILTTHSSEAKPRTSIDGKDGDPAFLFLPAAVIHSNLRQPA